MGESSGQIKITYKCIIAQKGQIAMGNHELQKNNVVTITGRIASELLFNHETFGEKFFMTFMSIERTSGVEDVIPVVVSERLVDVTQSILGEIVEIHGQYRSYSARKETGSHQILYVFAMEIEILGADKARKKIDCGKVMALHNTGLKNVKITEEIG